MLSQWRGLVFNDYNFTDHHKLLVTVYINTADQPQLAEIVTLLYLVYFNVLYTQSCQFGYKIKKCICMYVRITADQLRSQK